MFQIVFPMKFGSDIGKVEDVMPKDWIVDDPLRHDETFIVSNDLTGTRVGRVLVKPEKIVIEVNEEEPEGKQFWLDFSKRYPEIGPFDRRFGVVYLDTDDCFFDLDELPQSQSAQVLDMISHYVGHKYSYYVEFYLGNWHNHEELTVLECQQILSDGNLGPKTGVRTFLLGTGK